LSLEGERLNVDGDRVASAVAVALKAEALVIMTNVPGLLVNPDDLSTLIRSIPAHRLAEYVQYAHGRMRKKLLGAQEAVEGGVPQVCIGSTSLLNVLDGCGTIIETEPISAEGNHI
jgi:acetylglutamate/LysW-gamma-L-alpha-aminoadipate kinase